MGTCLGRCLRRSNSSGARRRRSRSGGSALFGQDESLEFFTLVEDNPTEQKISHSFVSRIFSKRDKQKNKFKRKPVLELAEDLWHPSGETNYFRLSSSSQHNLPVSSSAGDISLQCLDARALLNRGTKDHSVLSSSTPPSSLDLEWEHEGLPSPAPWHILPEDDLLQFELSSQTSQALSVQPRCASEVTNMSGWSRISTPDSLEWDPVQAPLHDSLDTSDLAVSELDAETEQLLSEIERLTKTALKETGRDLNR